MSKKVAVCGVFKNGDSEPMALFNLQSDAEVYGYVRFGDDYTTRIVSYPAKSLYDSLPFREGIAFNRVMKMRNDLFRRGGDV